MPEPKPEEYTQLIDLVVLDETDSTNSELRRILMGASVAAEEGSKTLDAGATDSRSKALYIPLRRTPLSAPIKAVIAHQQTGGLGRLGRHWTSPLGGLYLSIGLDTTSALGRESALSLLVAMSARKALERLVRHKQGSQNQEPILVKWPNDVICSRGKLVGILIESIQISSSQRAAVVGIGVNIARPTEGANEAAAYLSDISKASPTITEATQILLEELLTCYVEWQERNYHFDSFRDEFNEHLSLMGDEVSVKDSNNTVLARGRVEGVDSGGNLLLKDAEGKLLTCATGEITLRR